jgi:hypothetical protein
MFAKAPRRGVIAARACPRQLQVGQNWTQASL